MEAPFKKIGLAITFSPTSRVLLKEAYRLKKLFNAELVLIHVGEKNETSEKKIEEILIESSIDPAEILLIWGTGDPAKVIISKSKEYKLDLLVAGALEKEDIITYYTGSVARKLMRESPCSVLILVSSTPYERNFNKIFVNVHYEPECESAVQKAYQFALAEKPKEFVLITEIQVPGLSITVYDSGSTDETEQSRKVWKKEEEEKLNIFIKENNFSGLNISAVCLYGKSGWEVKNYVKENNGDLLVIASPKKKLKFFDRLFQHDLEFIFENLPCSILILKSC